jgi:hypothetical protein
MDITNLPISKVWIMIVLIFLLIPLTSFANRYVICKKTYYYHGKRYCRPYCYRHHYTKINYPVGEVDNACVDACLDLKTTLNQCTRLCTY